MGGIGPPTCLANTRHRARFFYKLYTYRASEAACGYLDVRRQHKGSIYAAIRTEPVLQLDTALCRDLFSRPEFSMRVIKMHRFCVSTSQQIPDYQPVESNVS
ncbi:hypothetical protein PUN28_008486 [Cardiocondyla obscurior]|uniref:Uncharacterized protein n=1 Tax=Cardiocondyla obscurior TaxID=286306 RepID=A0AAW2FYI8_9HYME